MDILTSTSSAGNYRSWVDFFA